MLKLCLFAVVALSLYPQPAAKGKAVNPKNGGEIRIKVPGKYLNRDFDPAGSGYPVVIEHLYEGLVRLDHNLEIFPGLADYWVVSDGGRKVRFYLSREAYFHNGQPVLAEDVKFSIERLFQEKKNPAFYSLAARIEGGEEFWNKLAPEVRGIKVIDPKTIEIEWKFPSVSNFYFLAAGFCKILPRNLLQKEKNSFFDRPVGSGPFRFDYWIRNSRLDIIGIRLARFEHYHGRKPYLEAIEVSPYFLLDDFLQNKIQVVPYLSYRIPTSKYQILENNLPRVVYLIFSTNLPPFDKPEVRKAIRAFIEKKVLAALASSPQYYAQVMDNFIPPFFPGFFPVEEESISLGRALEILRSAGLGDSSNPLVVRLYFFSPKKEIINGIFTQLKESLLPAGIKLELQGQAIPEQVKDEKVPYLIYFDWFMYIPDPEFVLYPLFGSNSALNQVYFHYKNSRLDDLLQAQRTLPSFDRRVKLFRQMEDVLREDPPAVPLFYYKERIAYQPYLKNFKPQTAGLFFVNLRNVWIDQ